MGISRFESPATIEAAIALLRGSTQSSAILGGGTDLIADVRAGRQVDLVVDIKKIVSLKSLSWEADGTLVIGACVPVQRVSEDEQIRKRYPALSTAAGNVGSLQVRCRATIAGNLGNASPCADNAPALLVLNAKVRIVSKDGPREVALDGFIRDVKKTALKRDEIIAAVIIPPQPAGLRSAFLKIKRVRGHDLALVNAAGAYDPASGEFRLAIGSAACTPILVRGIEAISPTDCPDDVGERLAERALASISPIDDVRASAEYRRDMTALLSRRLARLLLNGDATRS